jgi:chemotaxis protein CheX
MNLEELIAGSIRESAAQVFSTMLGIEIGPATVSTEHGTPAANDGVVSLIGLAGKWAGTGSLTCSPALACRLCSRMLMIECAAVNEEVLDAIAELTNMIVGSVKTELEAHLGALGLSIPTVVYGRNFKTRSVGNSEWTVVSFECEGENLVVRLCLTLKERPVYAHAHASGQTCALDV